jgi:hypothetical protein
MEDSLVWHTRSRIEYTTYSSSASLWHRPYTTGHTCTNSRSCSSIPIASTNPQTDLSRIGTDVLPLPGWRCGKNILPPNCFPTFTFWVVPIEFAWELFTTEHVGAAMWDTHIKGILVAVFVTIKIVRYRKYYIISSHSTTSSDRYILFTVVACHMRNGYIYLAWLSILCSNACILHTLICMFTYYTYRQTEIQILHWRHFSAISTNVLKFGSVPETISRFSIHFLANSNSSNMRVQCCPPRQSCTAKLQGSQSNDNYRRKSPYGLIFRNLIFSMLSRFEPWTMNVKIPCLLVHMRTQRVRGDDTEWYKVAKSCYFVLLLELVIRPTKSTDRSKVLSNATLRLLHVHETTTIIMISQVKVDRRRILGRYFNPHSKPGLNSQMLYIPLAIVFDNYVGALIAKIIYRRCVIAINHFHVKWIAVFIYKTQQRCDIVIYRIARNYARALRFCTIWITWTNSSRWSVFERVVDYRY